jgi:hypothetical protein
MPHFTITREVVNGDSIGCHNFQTNQFEDDMATINTPGATLDGDIVWYIDANPGYVVDVLHFDIPNTQPTPVAQSAGYKTREDDGSHLGLPNGVNGVVFEQVNNTRIKFTIFLHPSVTHGITGPVFVMPGGNVNIVIPIEGCARLISQTAQFRLSTPQLEGVETSAEMTEDYENTLVESVSGGEVIDITFPESESEDKEVISYTVKVIDGYEFVSSPVLSMGASDYSSTSTTKTDSTGKVISTTFKISKTV